MKKISIKGKIPKKYRVAGNYFYSPKAFIGDVEWMFKLEPDESPYRLVTRGITNEGREPYAGQLEISVEGDWEWGNEIEFYLVNEEVYTLAVLSGGTIWPTP